MNFFPDTHLKPSTYKTYNAHVLRWLAQFPSDQANIPFVYTHPNYAVIMLRKHLDVTQQNNARTVNSFIKALMAAVDANRHLISHFDDALLKKSDTRWKELRQITYNYAYAYRLEQQPSPLQQHMTGSKLVLDDLITLRDALPDGSIHKLLIGLYTHIPPVRADYYATQILPFGVTPTEPNYIFHSPEKSRLVLTDFKTNKFYKEISHDLPAELHRQLVLSLAASPRTYLFVNKNGEPFTRNGFTKWATEQLYQISKKGLTITMLRHIYISSLDLNSPPVRLLEIGKKMGHQLSQQMLYKWKKE
jgi:hypothetical protein